MERMQKHNFDNIQKIFEDRTGVTLQEETKPAMKLRPAWVTVLVTACFLLLAAFAYPIFSPLDGDALTLQATYEGNGIVSVQVENRSHKKITFQDETKLVKWLTKEEIAPLGDVGFTQTTIKAGDTATMILDLSKAYDMEMLESSKITEWYYLVLTNYDFLHGQEWKCSVYFGKPDENLPANEMEYATEADIAKEVAEELRFYFEDDYIGIFAANPLHYEYLQKVEELLLRSGKRIVPSVYPMLMAEPIVDGIIVDETYPAEKQYTLAGQTHALQDAFGKLTGGTDSEKFKCIDVFLPGEKGDEDTGWTLPLLFYGIYEVDAIESQEDCAFIHGRILSFGELAPYEVYRDEQFVCYDITDLFYTDLRTYVEDVMVYMDAMNAKYYFDEQVYARIENIYNYFKENLKIMTWEEFAKLRPDCRVEDGVHYENVVEDGLYGIVRSDNYEMEKIAVRIDIVNGEEIYYEEWIPENPHYYDLSQQTQVTEFIQSLPEGVYQLEIDAWVDSEVESYNGLCGMIFTTGDATWP